MAFQVGKREKIFVGVVGLVLSIAALHLMIFMPRHHDYVAEKSKYAAAQQAAPNGSTPANWQQVVATYQAESGNLHEEFMSLYQPMELDVSPEWVAAMTAYINGGNKFPYAGADYVAQQLIDDTKALVQYRNENPSIKLSFLGSESPSGWRLPDALPSAIQRGQINLQDLVQKIIEDNNMLVYLARAQPTTVERLWSSYQSELVQLTDTPADQWVQLMADVGNSLYNVKMLAHVDLVMSQLSQGGGSRVTRQALLDALRVQLDPIESYHLHRQLQSLVDILKMAKDSGVGEISRVHLGSHRKLLYDQQWANQAILLAGGTTPTPTPTLTPTPPPRGGGGYGGYGYGGYGGGYAAYGGGYGSYGAAGAISSTAEEIGDAMPLEIDFLGPNQSIVDCLFQVTSTPKNFDVDQLALGGMPVVKEAGKILARATIVVVTLTTVMNPK